MRRLKSLSLIAVLLPAALVGCGTKLEVELEPIGERATIIEKLPLKIGVFYSQSFRNYAYNRCIAVVAGKFAFLPPPCTSGGSPIDVKIGKASVASFDRTIRALFAQVKAVDSRRPNLRDGQMLDAIIEPEILKFEFSAYDGGSRIVWGATSTYRLVLRTPAGGELAQWSISGEANDASQTISVIAVALNNAAQGVLRALEAKTLAGFHEQPEFKRWLSSHGIEKVSSGRGKR